MKREYKFQSQQSEELLTYLGIGKSGLGRQYLGICFVEIKNGTAPGLELYERVARLYNTTAAQVVMCSQRALCRAQKKQPLKWEEIFPALNVERAGLTLFLRHATAWLRHNQIVSFHLGHEKYRMPVPKK